MKQIKRLILWIGVVGMVAACGTPAPALTPTSTGPRVVLTPGQLVATPVLDGAPRSVDQSKAQQAAVGALTAATNLPPDQISPVITEPMQWPNSCLGTDQPGITCTEQIVPGFRIVLVANNRRFEYHTNEDGTAIILATEQSPYVRVAVLTADKRIMLADTPVLFTPQLDLMLGGLRPQAGAAGSAIYALMPGDTGQVVELKAGETHPFDLVKNPSNGLAVWDSDTGEQPRLSWGTSLAGGNVASALWVSSLDGADLTKLVDAPVRTEAVQLVAQRWSLDGKSIFFSEEPAGATGYDPFAGASSLYRVALADKTVTELVAFNPASESS